MIGQSLLRAPIKPGERLVCYCPPGICQAPRGFRGPCNRHSDIVAAGEAEYQSWIPVMLEYERCRIALKKVVDDFMAERAGPQRTAIGMRREGGDVAESERPRFQTMLRKMWSGGEVQAWIDANWSATPAIPPGFKVVPLKATPEMIAAGVVHTSRYDEENAYRAKGEAICVYEDMLSAAPVPEAGQGVSDEQLARMFHDTYEQLAPAFGYETRPDTRQFDPDTANGRLMAAVCANMRALLSPAPAQAQAPVEVSDNKGAQK